MESAIGDAVRIPPATWPASPAPQVSTELFVIPLEQGRYIVYAPLRRAAFVGNAALVNFLAELKAGRYDHAADPEGSLVEFLRRIEIVDAGDEALPVIIFGGDPEPTVVTLFLTTTCNLRCTYCYASAGEFPQKFMSLDVAKRGIDFVAANAVRRGIGRFEVGYHGGGEPTLGWETLTRSLDYAKAKAQALGIGMTSGAATNGVLNDSQIDWILHNLDGMSVSFDGLPETHDRHRPTVAGKSSSLRVMHTLRRFDKAGYPYGIRVTVTRDQIEQLPDSIEFICANFRPQRIQIEPSYNLGRWTDAPSAETAGFIDAYREASRKAQTFGKHISFSAARLDTLTNHFCGVTQDNFCLSPDGNVSACYETFSEHNRLASVFFYGTPDGEGNGYRFDLARLQHLRLQAVQHRPYCRGCFAKWHCAGDCYHKALAQGETAEFSGSNRCHITRELTKDQILERISATGGWFWHEPPINTQADQSTMSR